MRHVSKAVYSIVLILFSDCFLLGPMRLSTSPVLFSRCN